MGTREAVSEERQRRRPHQGGGRRAAEPPCEGRACAVCVAWQGLRLLPECGGG